MASIKAIAAIALTLVIACPIGLGYLFAFDEEDVQSWQVSENVNISDLMLNNTNAYYQEYRGSSNNSTVHTYNVISDVSSEVPQYVTVADNPVTPYPVVVGGVTKYADVTDGWQVTTDNGYWYNSQQNIAARFIVWFEDGQFGSSTFRPKDSTNTVTPFTNPFHLQFDGTNTSIQIYSYNSRLDQPTPEIGPTIIQEYNLGQYSIVMVEINSDHTVKFSGLAGVPSMGTYPTTYHTISWNQAPEPYSTNPANAPTSFDRVDIMVYRSTIRVDVTTSQAGSYPATADYTLSPSELFPNESWKIKFNSIGVYGYSFSFAGNDYVVDNGKINVDGRNVALRGAVIESMYNSGSGQYDYAINGISVGSGDDPATAYFGGVWSLTATASLMEPVDAHVMKWQAGQFGFDKESLVAVGLLCAGAAFVVLGMTGRMSGPKVGILALICGGASVVYLLLL